MEKVNARTQALTRPMAWGEMPAFTAQNAQKKGNVIRMMEKMLGAAKRSEILRRSVKKYGILLISAALFTIYTILLSAGVEHRTEIRVRQEMADSAEQAVEKYKEDLKKQEDDAAQEKQKSGFLTGEDSLQNYIQILAGPLSVHVASLRMERNVTAAGAETYAWVDLARYASGRYGSTLEEVLSDPKQIEGYIEGHGTRPEDEEIGLRVAKDFVMKKYPTGFNMNMYFAMIMQDGSVEARDKYETDSHTRYFSIGK